MPSTYPGTLDSLPTDKGDDTDAVTGTPTGGASGDHADHHNDVADAINKIEAELGVNPSASGATVAARIAAAETAIPTVDETGAPHTLVLSDAGKLIQADGDVTIPPNSSVAFPLGTTISILNLSASGIEIIEGSGVTINSIGGDLAVDDQYAAVTLWKAGTDSWYLLAGGSGGGGGGSEAALVACRVFHNTTQSPGNDVDYNVLFNSEVYDTSSFHNTGTLTDRLVAPVDGVYEVKAHIQFAANATGYRRIALVHSLDGAFAQDNKPAIGDGTTPSRLTIAGERRFTAGEFARVQVRQNSGGALVISSAPEYSPYATMRRVGPLPA